MSQLNRWPGDDQGVSPEMQSRPGVREVPAKPVVVRQRKARRIYEYTPGTTWSHLKYGLGTLAVLVIPPLIPGVTGRGLVMGYVGLVVAVYGVVSVWGIVAGLRAMSGGVRSGR